MGNRKYARLPLGLNILYIGGGGGHDSVTTLSWGACTIDSSSMFICVHVGATSDLLCERGEREGKTSTHSHDGQSTALALYNHNHSECQSIWILYMRKLRFGLNHVCAHHCNCQRIMG